MTAATLTRFTVPLDPAQPNQGLLMPKLKWRFRVLLYQFGRGFGTTELTKQVKDATRPTLNLSRQTIDVYNSKIYYQGKPEWQEAKLTVRDDAVNSVNKLVGEQVQKQFDFFEQSSAASSGDYKFITRLEMLDGGNGNNTPIVLEAWEMYGCFLSQVDYGGMDYASNDPMEIALTISFDNALNIPLSDGIGQLVTNYQYNRTGTTGTAV